MLAQGGAGIFGAEQPAPLQQRDQLRAEHVEHRRQQRRHDVEAVGGAVLEPVLDQIGDLLGRASGGEMAARARAALISIATEGRTFRNRRDGPKAANYFPASIVLATSLRRSMAIGSSKML